MSMHPWVWRHYKLLCHGTSLLELTQEESYQMSQGLTLSEEEKALLCDLFLGKLSTLTFRHQH